MGEEHACQLHASPGRFQSITPTLSPVFGEYN
jgi:hypothetical protein